MSKNNEENPNNFNIIGPGTKIVGSIDANGDMRIDGCLEGNFLSKAKLVVGNTGQIKGEVKCKNAELYGEITGKLFIEELLMLRASAKVRGDIETQKLAIEPGAIFTGNCNMDGKHANNESKKAE